MSLSRHDCQNINQIMYQKRCSNTKENVKKENAFSAKKTSPADFWKRIVKKGVKN